MNQDQKASIVYRFDHVTHCEMCGDPVGSHKVLGQRLNTSQGRHPRRQTGITVSVVKCHRCGLVYNQPMPVPVDFQDHYGIDPAEYWNDEYYQLKPDYFSAEINSAKELLSFAPGMKALDIGASIGKCMIAMQNAGFDTYGIEPSLVFYEKAISMMKIDPSKLSIGMMEEMEYPENSFDLITFGAVFEHLYHPAQCLEKAMKWLKPNGIIHIEIPSARYFVSKIFNLYFSLKGTNYVTNTSPMHVPFHLYEFDLRSFEALGKKLNFKIERHEFNVCNLMHIPNIARPILRKYMEWTRTGMQLTVYLRK